VSPRFRWVFIVNDHEEEAGGGECLSSNMDESSHPRPYEFPLPVSENEERVRGNS